MVSTKFVATQQSDGSESITLLRERPGGLFKRASSETVSVSEWPKVAPEAGQAALALARSFDQEGQILEADGGVRSKESRVGQECDSEGRYRWSPLHQK